MAGDSSDDVLNEFMADGNHDYRTCGYCGGHFLYFLTGEMTNNAMTLSYYEHLLNEGWSRYGIYFHRKINAGCCKYFAIRCNVEHLRVSRSQKRMISQFNRYLNETSDLKKAFKITSKETETLTIPIKPNEPTHRIAVESAEQSSNGAKNSASSFVETGGHHKTGVKRDSEVKARRKRILRRLAKHKPVHKGLIRDPAKTLEVRLAEGVQMEYRTKTEISIKGTSKQLNIKIVKVGSPEEIDTRDESYKIYEAYQNAVHRGNHLGTSNWTDFLIRHPFQDDTNTSDEISLGLHHCYYRLNGVLVAVGVLEVLPTCINAGYLYYDPEYKFLNLGTYSMLIECFLARANNYHWLYMGDYVHSCQKLRYKASYQPAELALIEKFCWTDSKLVIPVLEQERIKAAKDAIGSKAEVKDPDFFTETSRIREPEGAERKEKLSHCALTSPEPLYITQYAQYEMASCPMKSSPLKVADSTRNSSVNSSSDWESVFKSFN